jgi:hypothetical protein
MSNKKILATSQTSSFTKACVVATTTLAMLAYSAFPLALFFNKSYFWQGLVSDLSEPGQPHSLLFTNIDIAAALFGVMFFSYLSWKQKQDKPQAIALKLVVVASVAELLTDIYSLPAGFSTTGAIPSAHYFVSHPALIVHLVASSVNSMAFVVSFGLWTLHRYRTGSKSLSRELIFVLALCVGIFGTLVGHAYPATSPTLQRVFILCYCYWFIALPLDLPILEQDQQVGISEYPILAKE